MNTVDDMLAALRAIVAAHAGVALGPEFGGLRVARHISSEQEHELASPMLILMLAGAKRLYFDRRIVEYGPGDGLVVTAATPLSGHFVGVSASEPALAIGLPLDSGEISGLLAEASRSLGRSTAGQGGLRVGAVDAALLDPIVRLLRLLEDRPSARVLAPGIRREILWRLLNGEMGSEVAQIGLGESRLSRIGLAVERIRSAPDESRSVAELARIARMSSSTFHRHFRAVTGVTPLQYQKFLRLQRARALLVENATDVTGAAHQVGYASATQFSREYRRLFGAAPRRDAQRLRASLD